MGIKSKQRNKKSKTYSFAEQELDILLKFNTDPENRPVIEEFIPEILALVNKFGNSGQSGGSAPYTATAISETIKKLCLRNPICPITGLKEEWGDMTGYGEDNKKKQYQNNRCYALFKNSDDRCWYLDAIAWKSERGACWSGGANLKIGHTYHKVYNRQFIKDFPFTPKTFYIDIFEKEVAQDDWEFYIKDEGQLLEAMEYYDNPEILKLIKQRRLITEKCNVE